MKAKTDTRSTRVRVNECADRLIESDGYSFTTGYMTSALIHALEMLPAGKRELFLSNFATDVRVRKV